MNILVADDTATGRKAIEAMIQGMGKYMLVENGDAAIAAIDKALETDSPYDLIFLDIDMPGMNGIDVLKFIRYIEKENKLSKEKQAKILMVTSNSDKEHVMQCIEAGCNGYIVKPIDKTTLLEKLKDLGVSV